MSLPAFGYKPPHSGPGRGPAPMEAVMSNRSKVSASWIAAPLTVACLLVVPPAARAGHRVTSRDHDRAVEGQAISVEVRVDGDWVPLMRAPHTWDRHYFEAQRGENYALRIRNRTDRRIGVLISVDGLNVVNGERSSLSPHEPMYVLGPRATSTIRGWRSSLDHVREFVFVDEERSYASRTDQANGDMGWIRVLAFEERSRGGWRYLDRENDDRDARHDKPEAAAPEASQKSRGENRLDSSPGTGWGDKRRDRVRETWFEPMAVACDHLVLRYEYERALIELGVYSRRHRDRDRLEERERGEWRFAQPPRR